MNQHRRARPKWRYAWSSRLVRLALAMGCFWVSLAGSAGAAVIERSGNTISITSPGDGAEVLSADLDGTFNFQRGEPGAPPMSSPGGTCTEVSADRVQCNATGIARITFDGGPGNDNFNFQNLNVQVHGDGGIGNDYIVGSEGPGVLHGGPGDDYIDGRAGADMLFGDQGDDTFGLVDAGDIVDGGDGLDAIDFNNEGFAGVIVTLDDVANDPRPGVGANVLSTVEMVTGSTFADVIVGNGFSNVLLGGGGNDEIHAGGGSDHVRGDAGNDLIVTHGDNAADFVDCGEGDDTARVDPLDETQGCEHVEIVGPDADGDGFKPPIDCDDANPLAHPGGIDVPGNGADEDCNGADAPLLDADGDGVTSERDCDESNPRIRPGAVDRPGNRVDEDCNGADAPYPRARGSLKYAFTTLGSVTRAKQLLVVNAARGTRVKVSCRGPGCRRGKTVRLKRGGRRSLLPVTGRRFRAGATLTIRILQANAIGEARTFKFRSGKSVVPKLRCIRPGARRTIAC